MAFVKVSPDDAAKMRALEMEVSNLEKEWNDANGEASAQFQRVQEAEARIENVGNGAVKQLSDQIKNTKDVSQSANSLFEWDVPSRNLQRAVRRLHRINGQSRMHQRSTMNWNRI